MKEQTRFSTQADALLTETYPASGPGAAVLVQKDDQIWLRKGYGLANIELNVPIEPDMYFRLGSITKQFTALAILMLFEQGKLDLQDEITRFLPDYPTRGEKITIEHLLTHTSGIPSYTEQLEWLSMWRKDMTSAEIIELTRDKPLDFKPGEKFAYNNTGYVMLGAVIEKLGGMPYAQCVQKNIFEPLGMVSSHYDDPIHLIPGRVSGYSRQGDQIVNAGYLSMTQPHAAGALASTVDDMARWNSGILAGKIVKIETLQKAFQSYKLTDGRKTSYGYGWAICDYEGWTFIEHGGGIHGFSTHAISVPAEKLFLVVLTNCEVPKPSPEIIALRLAGLALGKPYQEPTPIEIDGTILKEYTGVYKVDETARRYITQEGKKLYSQRTGGMRIELNAYTPDKFFTKDSPSHFHFQRDENNLVIGMELVGRFGPAEPAPRVDEPLPEPRHGIDLDPTSLGIYTGVYELAPGANIIVRTEAGHLQVNAPGEDKFFNLLAETPQKLFLDEAEINFEFDFPGSGEPASRLTLHQGGKSYPCNRVEGMT